MEKWYMQVKIFDQEKEKYVWKDVHPTYGQPYTYETKIEAFNMLNMCYGSCVYGEKVRIIKK